MIETLENTEVDTVKLTIQDTYRWENDEEININGEMFDIKKAQHIGDTLVLTGLYDKHEDAIKNKVKELFNKTNSERRNSSNVMSYLFFSLLYPPDFATSFISRPTTEMFYTHFFPDFISELHFAFLKLPSPPPKC